MQRNLKVNIFVLIGVAIAGFILSVSVIMSVLYNHFTEVQQSQLKMQTQMVAQGVLHEGVSYLEAIEGQEYRITWIDGDGQVLFDNQNSSYEMENHLEREEIINALSDGYGSSQRYSATMMEKMLYSAYKIPDGTIIRLAMPQSTIFSLLWKMAGPIAIVLFVLIAVCIFISHKATRKADEEENEAMRREFTANVSHELKSPLHVISGYAELIENGMVMPEDTELFAKKIRNEVQRMIQLIQDIITLSRLDESKENMTMYEVNLYQLALGVKEKLSLTAEKNNITIEIIGQQVTMKGIPHLLSSMLYNLCDNAIKYNSQYGTVVIEVNEDYGRPMFSVRDTGIGIAKSDYQRIFERFYRVDKSHSKAVGGTGLGLSIVKHAAKLHNAKIEVDSIIGEGTLITVKF